VKIETIEAAMLAGGKDGVGLSLDSTAFERAGNRLEQGLLKHLEQFHGGGVLLLSEVVRGELHAHLLKRTLETRQALSSAIAASSDYWPNTDVQRKEAIEGLTDGNGAAEALVDKRIESFVSRCGVVSVPANLAALDDIVERYFSVKPPFEGVAKKKNEFPDAIALLSIESWARTNAKPVIVVSADKGWNDFAETSDLLCCIPELSQALTMFQQRDEKRLALVELVASHVDAAPDWEGFEMLKEEVSQIEWYPLAFAIFDVEVEMQIEVDEVSFAGSDAADSLSLIDYDGVHLTVYAVLESRLKVDAQFGFTYDGVSMGSSTFDGVFDIPIEAVLSFEFRPNGTPLLVSVDIDQRRQQLEFGDVEPDYSSDRDYDGI
jgi:hypothetical protein